MRVGVLSVVATFVALAACASGGGRSQCAPVTGDYLAAGVVYRDCEVSLVAEMQTRPRIDMPMRMEGTSPCYSAWFDFVVDTTGHVVESTAKLIRTNNKVWSEAVHRQLSEARYRPAEKSGQRVQQLVRYKANIALVRMSTPQGGVGAGPTASGNRPNC